MILDYFNKRKRIVILSNFNHNKTTMWQWAKKQKKLTLSCLAAAILILNYVPVVLASCNVELQSCSTNYGVNEVLFGSGGGDTSSSHYQARTSLGEVGIGQNTSTNYVTRQGFNTYRTPYLEFTVNAASSPDIGVLTPGTPKTDTATFSVRDYLSSGYLIITASSSPTNDTYQMTTPSSPETIATMTSSNHEFGINLKANTGGCGAGLSNFGVDPSQSPDSSFSFGQAATGYDTACQFKYANGDTIASSTKSSGETDYTISYVFLANNLTPGGTYTLNQILVATATY